MTPPKDKEVLPTHFSSLPAETTSRPSRARVLGGSGQRAALPHPTGALPAGHCALWTACLHGHRSHRAGLLLQQLPYASPQPLAQCSAPLNDRQMSACP